MSKLIKQGNMPFTQISNDVLNDRTLSIKAKGLYCYLYGKPDSWQFSADRIANDQKDGEGAIQSALKELESQGRIKREKRGDGRMDYIIYRQKNQEKNEKKEDPKPQEAKEPECQNGVLGGINNKDSKKEIYISNKDIIYNNTTLCVDGDNSSFSGDVTNGIIVQEEKEKSSAKKESSQIKEYQPKEITLQINEVIDLIKSQCRLAGVMYSADTQERNYTKHLISKKFTSDVFEQTGYELKPFLEAIIMLSTKVKYTKPINSAKTIYYNRADTVNKAKKENMQIQHQQKKVFEY